jgi:hypothetical protein
MNKNLKLSLASLAIIAAISVTSLPANATDAPAEAPAATVVELQNGTKVKVEGENVFVVAEDGTTTPAPDGDHLAKDGTTIKTKDGVIVK